MAICDLPYQLPEMVENIHENLSRKYDHIRDSSGDRFFHTLPANAALKIAVTNRCNLSCSYCYYRHDQEEKDKDMSMQMVDRLFEFYPHPTSVFILGGEPFLNPKAVIRVLERCPSRVVISTNGQINNRDTQRIFDAIIRRQESDRETLFQVSSEEGGVTNERGKSNLSFLVGQLPQLPRDIVKVKFTFTEPNISSIYKTTSFYWDLGIPVHYDFADGGFGEGSNIGLGNEAWKTAYQFMVDTLYDSFYSWRENKDDIWLVDRARVLVNQIFPGVLRILRSGSPPMISCSVFNHSLFVAPSGNVHPCHRWRHNESYNWRQLGEVKRRSIIQFCEQEWRTSREHCALCRWRGVCGGLCPAVMSEYGPQALEGRCKFAGSLRDAVFRFLVDEKVMYHPDIDEYISLVSRKTADSKSRGSK